MAHNLDTLRGVAATFSVAEENATLGSPWHGLGAVVSGYPEWEAASKAAQLDWSVALADGVTRYTHKGKEYFLPIPGVKTVLRIDDQLADPFVLAQVSDSYKPIQNDEVFAFLDTLVKDHKMTYSTAGSLDSGRRIWVSARFPDVVNIKGDEVVKYILAASSHDSSLALTVMNTPLRTVCQNTLNMNLNNPRLEKLTIVHKGDMTAKLDAAREVLGLQEKSYALFEEQMNALASYAVTPAAALEYVTALFPDPVVKEGEDAEDETRGKVRAQNTREEILKLFEKGRGNDQQSIRHTAYALYNGATEYFDWFYRNGNLILKPGEDADQKRLERTETRFESMMFGNIGNQKKNSLKVALDMVGHSANTVVEAVKAKRGRPKKNAA